MDIVVTILGKNGVLCDNVKRIGHLSDTGISLISGGDTVLIEGNDLVVLSFLDSHAEISGKIKKVTL